MSFRVCFGFLVAVERRECVMMWMEGRFLKLPVESGYHGLQSRYYTSVR